jgi:hypothetical protein
MMKKPLECKLGLTIKCPHWDNPAMEQLFAKFTYDLPVEFDINAAKLICQGCKSFEPFPKKT